MFFFACRLRANARSARALGPPRQLRIPPVDSFEHVGHLPRRNRNDALLRRRPDELSRGRAASRTAIARRRRARGSSPDRLCVRGRCKDRRRAGRASTAPEPEAPDPACRDACRCGPPRSTPAPRSASGSSFAQNAQNPTKRIGVHVVVDAHAAPRAELDFDDAGPRSPSARRRARRSRRLRRRWRRRRVDLDRKQNRAVSPRRFRRARQPSPCEEQALRHAVPSSDLAHHGPRHQRLFDDPRLLVLAPTPSALDPENLPIHLCVTLRLALRSHPSRPPRPQARRPPPEGYQMALTLKVFWTAA